MLKLNQGLFYFNDLKDSWYIINHSDETHYLKYNKSYVHPILTEGWSDLQIYNDFPDNVEVLFGYYGHNLYFVEMFREITDRTLIPPFHSLSKMPLHTLHFHTYLTEVDFINPFMVNL
jgi:hypothetical protein